MSNVTTYTERTHSLEIQWSGENQVTNLVSKMSSLTKECAHIFLRLIGNKPLIALIGSLSCNALLEYFSIPSKIASKWELKLLSTLSRIPCPLVSQP